MQTVWWVNEHMRAHTLSLNLFSWPRIREKVLHTVTHTHTHTHTHTYSRVVDLKWMCFYLKQSPSHIQPGTLTAQFLSYTIHLPKQTFFLPLLLSFPKQQLMKKRGSVLCDYPLLSFHFLLINNSLVPGFISYTMQSTVKSVHLDCKFINVNITFYFTFILISISKWLSRYSFNKHILLTLWGVSNCVCTSLFELLRDLRVWSP